MRKNFITAQQSGTSLSLNQESKDILYGGSPLMVNAPNAPKVNYGIGYRGLGEDEKQR